MSYDIFVQDLPPGIRDISEIPDDFVPHPLGPRVDILETIRRIVPTAVFDETGWGTIDGPDYWIEVNLGTEDPVPEFTLLVRGSGKALFLVAEILGALRLRALAPGSESGLFSVDADTPAYAAWQAYRARIVGE